VADWAGVERVLSAFDAVQGIGDLSIHRDGETLALQVSPAHREPETSFASRIWRVTSAGEIAQLTFGPGADVMPRWSPTSDLLAFASDRDRRGRMSPFVVDPGEEPRPLGSIDGSVQQVTWAADGSALLALAVDEGGFGAATDGAVRLVWSDPRPDPLVLRPLQGWRRLFRIDLESGATTEIGPEGVNVWEFDVVDDSTVVGIVSDDPSENGWYRSRLAMLDLERRDLQELWTPERQIQGPAADASGKKVAVIEGWSSDRGLVAGDIRVIDVDTGQATHLDISDVTSLGWIDTTTLWFAGWHETGSRFGEVGDDGSLLWETTEEAVIGTSSFNASLQPVADGQIAVRETVDSPPEVGVYSEHQWKALTSFNDLALGETLVHPEVRTLEWEGPDGLPIRGLVLIPEGDPPFPMVVVIHGGPTYAWKHSLDPGFSLYLVAAGYCVFLPNYRGSTGRGQSFTRLNVGDPAGAEFEDILSGVDHCISLGLATPERLGVTGGSYGGYLTAWAACTTDRFRAAVMVSGIVNMLSCHLTCNHAFSEHMFGGDHRDPEALDLFRERSPISYVASATTPTLILHGTEDECTPIGQAQELYKALVLSGVPTELVAYPREGHGFQEREHALDAQRRTVAWFERFLED
jgi:dipeptidyl aminopeptidase/acylaminoacyl peptidase